MGVPQAFENQNFQPFGTAVNSTDAEYSRQSEGSPPGGTVDQEAHPQVSHWAWQDQLIPLANIHQEDNCFVLRQELETAHHLLQYQQQLIGSLTEQLTSRETHLVQVESDLEDAKQRCIRQTENISDVEAVCHDLRTQLRRQQQHLCAPQRAIGQGHTPARPPDSFSAEKLVAFGYGPNPFPAHPAETNAPPVPTWSAGTGVDLTGSLAIYHKLAAVHLSAPKSPMHHRRPRRHTVRPEPGVRHDRRQGHRVAIANSGRSTSKSESRVELPSFARS